MREDNLILSDWVILQQEEKFRFGTDAVLLYGIVPRPCGKTADLCSGSGAVALMLIAGGKTEQVTAVEIQSECCRLTIESAEKNGASARLTTLCADICKISDFLQEGTFDTVTVNPPYFKKGSGLLPPDESVAISRHELLCTIDDVFSAAAYLLKDDGKFYMVHRTDRQKEILAKIQKFGLFPTEIYRVFSKPSKESKLFLVAATKGRAERECKYIDFTVANEDGSLTKAYKSIQEE